MESPKSERLLIIALVALVLVLLALHAGLCSAADYYVDRVAGDNSNTGTSPGSAFRTVAPFAKMDLAPGDRILLNRNKKHSGMLKLFEDTGTADEPIIVTSYGDPYIPNEPRAWLTSTTAAIWIANTSHVVLDGLKLQSNKASPVLVLARDTRTVDPIPTEGVTVRNCELVGGKESLHGVELNGSLARINDINVERNLVGYFGDSGISANGNIGTMVVRDNVIRHTGLTHPGGAGIHAVGADSTTAAGNHLLDNLNGIVMVGPGAVQWNRIERTAEVAIDAPGAAVEHNAVDVSWSEVCETIEPPFPPPATESVCAMGSTNWTKICQNEEVPDDLDCDRLVHVGRSLCYYAWTVVELPLAVDGSATCHLRCPYCETLHRTAPPATNPTSLYDATDDLFEWFGFPPDPNTNPGEYTCGVRCPTCGRIPEFIGRFDPIWVTREAQ